MERFNSSEVGSALANSLIRMVDPLQNVDDSEEEVFPPLFSMPKVG